ncbi:MAG: DUF4058 family protein [Cyanobacteria bacterium P01_H01_bin.119]
MHNPFPGMNPFLEQPGLWPQVHNRLIVAIADQITPQVAPKYRVSIEERVYTSAEPMPLIGVADVSVSDRKINTPLPIQTTQVIEPRQVTIPLPVEITERFLAVRLVQTNQLICIVEVLSPANKRSGEGRLAYERKRAEILGSATHLVEIDLLRGGTPMVLDGRSSKPYSILISTSSIRPSADLYEFDLADPIPSFPVPLRSGDAQPAVDLQEQLNGIYTRARLDLSIDYTQPLQPKLSDEAATWMKTCLRTDA